MCDFRKNWFYKDNSNTLLIVPIRLSRFPNKISRSPRRCSKHYSIGEDVGPEPVNSISGFNEMRLIQISTILEAY
jgi:hypothetical protein